jgi:hypothetical protein
MSLAWKNLVFRNELGIRNIKRDTIGLRGIVELMDVFETVSSFFYGVWKAA